MKFILVALLMLPLAAHSQMRCPDGSYRDACDGGAPIGGGGISSYSSPGPPVNFNRDTSERWRQAGEATRRNEPVQRPRSTAERAADAGISRNDLVRARSRGELLVGMSRQDVEHIMGRPDSVRTFVDGHQRCDNLWYSARRTRITMCGGQLRSYGAANRQ